VRVGGELAGVDEQGGLARGDGRKVGGVTGREEV
jgi:hypothetical protein